MSRRSRTTLLLVAIGALLLATLPAQATHSWGGYHWARTANPFTLMLGDNVTATWDAHLVKASADWNASSVLGTTIVEGRTKARQCNATDGRVEVCNERYGFNGWLGVAGISVSGGHIQSGYVKLNDSYFSSGTYNTYAWRQSVMCQEIGHTFGLGHNDEDFSTTTGTCMDYSNEPQSNTSPNGHDFSQLETIYGHLDTFNSYDDGTTSGGDDGGGSTGPGNGKGGGKKGTTGATASDAGLWGREVASDGRTSTFVREDGDTTLITHVVWAR